MQSTSAVIPLAPSVIKTLARALRKQPGVPSLTVAQSLEVMAQTLGYASWHAANQRKSALPEAAGPRRVEVEEMFTVLRVRASGHARARRRFYRQMEQSAEVGLTPQEGLEAYVKAYRKWNPEAVELLLFERVFEAMRAGSAFSAAVEDALEGWPVGLEVEAIASGERHRCLAKGLAAARELIQ